MTAIDTLRAILASIERTPLRDSAGILTPQGIDASIEARAIRKAIAMVEWAERKRGKECKS